MYAIHGWCRALVTTETISSTKGTNKDSRKHIRILRVGLDKVSWVPCYYSSWPSWQCSNPTPFSNDHLGLFRATPPNKGWDTSKGKYDFQGFSLPYPKPINHYPIIGLESFTKFSVAATKGLPRLVAVSD